MRAGSRSVLPGLLFAARVARMEKLHPVLAATAVVLVLVLAAPSSAFAQPCAPTSEPCPDLAEQSRFRWAVHYELGPWFVPHRTGGATGIGIQLGTQLNDMVGVYYSGTVATGFASGYDARTESVGASFGAWFYNAVMADVTLERLVQVGIGPSIDTLAFGTADVKPTATGAAGRVTGLSGTYFGVQTRVGLVLGGRRKTGKAARFMLGLEVHPTFGDGPSVSTMLTIGGGVF